MTKKNNGVATEQFKKSGDGIEKVDAATLADSSDKTRSRSHPIATTITGFLDRLADLHQAALVASEAVTKWRETELEKQKKILKKYTGGDTTEGRHEVRTGAHGASEILKTANAMNGLLKSQPITVLMRSLYVGIFSEYDVFTGNLLRVLYEEKPDLFKNIKREITLSELLEFDSVNAVKQDMLAKEIDSFRRNSYVEQFNEMEKKFDLTLKEFSEWAMFVEFGQRRNLLTHNDGMCSDQYLHVCDKEKFNFPQRPQLGEKLLVTKDYFNNAVVVVAKVATMLAHTLWRKLLPHQTHIANESFNNMLYDLMQAEKWSIAAEFGSFGLSKPMQANINDLDRRLRVINTAIALRYTDRKDEGRILLGKTDWSASLREFQLAIEILNDEYDKAANIMRSIGKRGELLSQLDYHTWPLFREFRDRGEFQLAYKEIYKIPFIEEVAREVKAIAVSTESDGNNKKKSINGGEEKTISARVVGISPRLTKPSRSAAISGRGARSAYQKIDESISVPMPQEAAKKTNSQKAT